MDIKELKTGLYYIKNNDNSTGYTHFPLDKMEDVDLPTLALLMRHSDDISNFLYYSEKRAIEDSMVVTKNGIQYMFNSNYKLVLDLIEFLSSTEAQRKKIMKELKRNKEIENIKVTDCEIRSGDGYLVYSKNGDRVTDKMDRSQLIDLKRRIKLEAYEKVKMIDAALEK